MEHPYIYTPIYKYIYIQDQWSTHVYKHPYIYTHTRIYIQHRRAVEPPKKADGCTHIRIYIHMIHTCIQHRRAVEPPMEAPKTNNFMSSA